MFYPMLHIFNWMVFAINAQKHQIIWSAWRSAMSDSAVIHQKRTSQKTKYAHEKQRGCITTLPTRIVLGIKKTQFSSCVTTVRGWESDWQIRHRERPDTVSGRANQTLRKSAEVIGRFADSSDSRVISWSLSQACSRVREWDALLL